MKSPTIKSFAWPKPSAPLTWMRTHTLRLLPEEECLLLRARVRARRAAACLVLLLACASTGRAQWPAAQAVAPADAAPAEPPPAREQPSTQPADAATAPASATSEATPP